jgi:hypothetical protein
MGKKIGILNPHRKHPSRVLLTEADFFKTIRVGVLQKSQFPAELVDSQGVFRKPSTW